MCVLVLVEAIAAVGRAGRGPQEVRAEATDRSETETDVGLKSWIMGKRVFVEIGGKGYKQ